MLVEFKGSVMPNKFISDAAKSSEQSRVKLEHTFKKVANNAKKEGMTQPYAVATSAIEKMTHYNPKKEV